MTTPESRRFTSNLKMTPAFGRLFRLPLGAFQLLVLIGNGDARRLPNRFRIPRDFGGMVHRVLRLIV
jgi:hypothetical protein